MITHFPYLAFVMKASLALQIRLDGWLVIEGKQTVKQVQKWCLRA